MKEEKKACENEKEQWKLIRNVETNESWYYNTVTESSQWDKPEAVQEAERLARLPTIASPTTPSGMRGYSPSEYSDTDSSLPPLSRSVSEIDDDFHAEALVNSRTEPAHEIYSAVLPGLTATKNARESSPNNLHFEIDGNGMEANNVLSTQNVEVKKAEEADLFLADGSRSTHIRQIIRDNLKTKRFDSIHQLIALQPFPNNNNDTNDAPPSPKSTSKEGGRKPLWRNPKGVQRYMVAQVPSKKKKKKNKSILSLAAISTPVLRNIEDPGFDGFTENTDKKNSFNQKRRTRRKAVKCMMCFFSGGLCHEHGNKIGCNAWDIDRLRRQYRSEELQELFDLNIEIMKKDTSQFRPLLLVKEFRHPIYQGVADNRLKLNKTARRKIHCRAWFRSFLEHLRMGKDRSEISTGAALLRLKNTIGNTKWCQSYTDTVIVYQPIPPVTRIRIKKYDYEDVVDVVYMDTSVIPTRRLIPTACPEPFSLFQPREYTLSSTRQVVPMPEPSFTFDVPLPVSNTHLESSNKVSWFERLCARTALSVERTATRQITACSSPAPRQEDNGGQAAQPLTTTVNFASFGKKGTVGNLAIGGLACDVIVQMLVTTFVPPQFINYSVMQKSSISPLVTKDYQAPYPCPNSALTQCEYQLRLLISSLNVRRPPTVTISTCAPSTDFNFHGENRSDQTGENDNFGFYTTLPYKGIHIAEQEEGVTFTPGSDTISFNLTSTNSTTTTRATKGYPFCEASTTSNTVFEFIHLLMIGISTRNQVQVIIVFIIFE